jgi:hypothetical protein
MDNSNNYRVCAKCGELLAHYEFSVSHPQYCVACLNTYDLMKPKPIDPSMGDYDRRLMLARQNARDRNSTRSHKVSAYRADMNNPRLCRTCGVRKPGYEFAYPWARVCKLHE